MSLIFDKILKLVFFSWGGVRLSPLGTSATYWPIVPATNLLSYGMGISEI
jgi:hypothetical protein